MVARLQRRLLHLLCQAIEENLDGVLLSKIPLPTPDDEFHPATMCLGGQITVGHFKHLLHLSYTACFLLV